MDEISVEVAFATLNKQSILAITVAENSTVKQVINSSGILNQFPEIDLTKMSVGVFGKLCKLDRLIGHGERIEIYRPLLQHPMDARRNRAAL